LNNTLEFNKQRRFDKIQGSNELCMNFRRFEPKLV
jgi:hypothetical protein